MGVLGLGIPRGPASLCRFYFSDPEDTGFTDGELGGAV